MQSTMGDLDTCKAPQGISTVSGPDLEPAVAATKRNGFNYNLDCSFESRVNGSKMRYLQQGYLFDITGHERKGIFNTNCSPS